MFQQKLFHVEGYHFMNLRKCQLTNFGFQQGQRVAPRHKSDFKKKKELRGIQRKS